MSVARKRSTSTSWIRRPLGLRPRTWARRRFARREPGTRSAGPRAARTPTTAPFSVIGAKRGVTLTPPSRARKLAGSAVPSAPVPKRNSTLTKGCAEATVRPAGSTTRRSWFALARAAEAGAGRKTAQQSSRITARFIPGPEPTRANGAFATRKFRLLASSRKHGNCYVVWEGVGLLVGTTEGRRVDGHPVGLEAKGDHPIELATGHVHGPVRGGEADRRHDGVRRGDERRLLRQANRRRVGQTRLGLQAIRIQASLEVLRADERLAARVEHEVLVLEHRRRLARRTLLALLLRLTARAPRRGEEVREVAAALGHHVPVGVLALVAEGAVGLEAESGETVDRALLDVDEVADDDESLRPLEALARRVRPHDRGPVLLAQAAAAGLWQAAVGVQAVDRDAPGDVVRADVEEPAGRLRVEEVVGGLALDAAGEALGEPAFGVEREGLEEAQMRDVERLPVGVEGQVLRVEALDRLRAGEAPEPAVLADPERLDAVGLGDVEDAVADQHAPRQPPERGDLHRGGRGERAGRPEAGAVDPLLRGGGRGGDRAGERRLGDEQRDEESTNHGAHEAATYSNRVGMREAIARGAGAAHNRRPRPRRCHARARQQPPRRGATLRGARSA